MKLLIFCLISLILSCSACNENMNVKNQTKDIVTIQNEVEETLAEEGTEALNDIDDTTAYYIDVELQKELLLCKSNTERTDAYCKFAQKWYALGEYYCNQILNNNFDMHKDMIVSSVSDIHENWKTYIAVRINQEQQRLEGCYGGGSIVPILIAEYQYYSYRTHSLELYNMCVEMSVECDKP